MKIYLACTVRGDRCALGVLRALADTLEQLGHTVLTRHLLADDVETAESALNEREVFERDMKWLAAADLVVAEASGSSYGVGFEVGYVLGRNERHAAGQPLRHGDAAGGQHVLLLYDQARRGSVSRLIAGNAHPNCTTYAYRDGDDLLTLVRTHLASVAEAR